MTHINSPGQPEVTVSTIMVPENASYDKVVSCQVAEGSGVQIICPLLHASDWFPVCLRRQWRRRDAPHSRGSNEGWIVSSPNWEGPNSTFIDIEGFQAGQSTLDPVRAILSSGKITGGQRCEGLDVGLQGWCTRFIICPGAQVRWCCDRWSDPGRTQCV